jgi:hypothetical protein
LTALNAAQSEGLKIVMNNATKGGSGQDDLAWYCRLYWGSWEAEDSVNFIYWNGDTISDPFANNGMAFVARMALMSETPMLKTCCEHMRQYNSTMTYNVIYHLKIDSLSVDTLANDVPVCSLYITKVGNTPLIGEVITADAFTSVNEYAEFTLDYDCPNSNNQLYYGLFWFDNCDLYCDYI